MAMIRDYIRKVIDEEIGAKHSDLVMLAKRVRELQLDIDKAKSDIQSVNFQLEQYPNDLEETKDAAEEAILRMVQDTILKLESYEEAANAILGKRR